MNNLLLFFFFFPGKSMIVNNREVQNLKYMYVFVLLILLLTNCIKNIKTSFIFTYLLSFNQANHDCGI